jgi:hypothetical protein
VSNYRDPTTEIDLECVGARCFSEAGMGKGEGDGNGAVIKGRMKRARDEGHGIEGAKNLGKHTPCSTSIDLMRMASVTAIPFVETSASGRSTADYIL